MGATVYADGRIIFGVNCSGWWLNGDPSLAFCAFAGNWVANFIYDGGPIVAQPLSITSQRAIKARYGKKLQAPLLQKSLAMFGYLLLISGVILAALSQPTGYLLVSPGLLLLMLRFWYQGELKQLAVDGHGVDGLLAQDTLANLKTDEPSALQIWEAVKKSRASYFVQNRFTLPPSIFDSFLAKDANSGHIVWHKAEELRQKHGAIGYDNSIIILALLNSIPNVAQLLSRIKLDIKDVESAIPWLAHVEAKQRLASSDHRFGGWARDWTFGYTPVLRYLGQNISHEIQSYGFLTDISRHQPVVEQMVQGMSTGNSTITLVGDIGVGKTTCVYAFADRLIEDKSVPKNIRYSQVVSLDAPTILAQTKDPGELEGLVLRILREAQKAKNIILFFDNAHVFFSREEGSVDLTNILEPALESGAVRIIFAMTPKEWQSLGRGNAAVASRLQPIQMKPANESETIQVLRDQVLFIEYERKALFTFQALREAFRLGSRYVDNQVMPGAALSVLKGATPLAPDGYVTDEVVKQSIESSTGVKLQHAAADESQKLLNLEDELHKYVINQKRAVSVVADALRRSRSGVGNPDRPVGTFLFLGPTGVGKTELSKALARVYFGSEQSVIRVDMNQYLQPSDAQRLISPMLGDQLGFLGQVRKTPFSVILLDEIEKAHSSVVNLLLQMLDEGVMRDADNKAVSFKDSIIIATSNAGADEIRRIIDEGGDIIEKEPEFVDGLIKKGIFAPEFLNRFDEVVLFRPLTPEELIQVIDLIIAGINKTLDNQKVTVALTEDAKKWLVNKGYDAKLGARPMRRVVQKYVENILAKKLLSHSAGSGEEIHLDIADFEGTEA